MNIQFCPVRPMEGIDPFSLDDGDGHPLTMESFHEDSVTYGKVSITPRLADNAAHDGANPASDLLEIGQQTTNTHDGNTYEHSIYNNTDAIRSQLQVFELKSLLSKWNLEAIVDELIGK